MNKIFTRTNNVMNNNWFYIIIEIAYEGEFYLNNNDMVYNRKYSYTTVI